jgi:hypothetical protein
MLRRKTVYSPILDLVRTHRIPGAPASGPHGIATAGDGTSVLVLSPTPDLGSVPFHHLDRTGNIVRSFGESNNAASKVLPTALTLTGRGTLWAWHSSSYMLEEWSTANGALKRRVARKVAWFPDGAKTRRSEKEDASTGGWPPQVISVQEDEEGRLWTLISVPRKSYWAKGHRPGSPIDFPAAFESIIEVIDITQRRVLASARLPHLWGFIGKKVALQGTETDPDITSVVLRLRLARS